MSVIKLPGLLVDEKVYIIVVVIIHLVVRVMEPEMTVMDPPVSTSHSRCDLLYDLIQKRLIPVDIYPAGRDDLIGLIELEGMDDLDRLPLADVYIPVLLIVPGLAHLTVHILLPAEIS